MKRGYSRLTTGNFGGCDTFTPSAAATIARYYARDFAMFGYDDSYEDLCPGCREYADAREATRKKTCKSVSQVRSREDTPACRSPVF